VKEENAWVLGWISKWFAGIKEREEEKSSE